MAAVLSQAAALSSAATISGRQFATSPSSQVATRRPSLAIRAATLSGGGTQSSRKVKVVDKGVLRDKAAGTETDVKLLSRVEELRLLSKLEQAGLLSKIEKLGLSLSKIESLGLLSKAESLGVLSLATDRTTPNILLAASLACLVGAPILVFLVGDESSGIVLAQFLGAAVLVGTGAALFGGSQLLSSLQD